VGAVGRRTLGSDPVDRRSYNRSDGCRSFPRLPKGSRQIEDLETIEEQFPVASSIVVVLQARKRNPGREAEDTVKRAVDALVEELPASEYSKFIVRVEGKLDQSFFKEHGLMVSKVKDIERMRRVFADLNLVPLLRHLNDDFEREYSGNEKKLSEDEETATAQFEGLDQLLAILDETASGEDVPGQQLSISLDRFLFGAF
jgi:Fe-S cluster assembly ATPase SufC